MLRPPAYCRLALRLSHLPEAEGMLRLMPSMRLYRLCLSLQHSCKTAKLLVHFICF